MMNKRYMINTKTGVILPYDSNVMSLGKTNIKECTADGVLIGAGNTEKDEMLTRIGELESLIDEKNRRIAALESYISELESRRINNDAELRRRRELEDTDYQDLKVLAADIGVPAVGKKNELIDAIIAKEMEK